MRKLIIKREKRKLGIEQRDRIEGEDRWQK